MTSSARAQISTLRVREAFVRERFGDDGVERLHAAMSPPLRAALASPDPPDGWVDFAAFVELNVLIDRLFGSGDLSLVRRLGHYAAQHNAGIWRAMFEKGVDVPKFVEIAGGLWHKHYDSGSLVRGVVGGDAVDVEIESFPSPHRAHCLAVVGWVAGVFELKPETKVDVVERSCRASGGSTCVFRITWR